MQADAARKMQTGGKKAEAPYYWISLIVHGAMVLAFLASLVMFALGY